MFETQLDASKIKVYRATDYRIDFPNLIMAVGLRSEPMHRLFDRKGVICAAFVTAYNPRGTLQPEAKNDSAHKLLDAKLASIGVEALEGSGSKPGSDWPAEKSFLALGLSRQDTMNLGLQFQQDAVVWVGKTCVPELILLR